MMIPISVPIPIAVPIPLPVAVARWRAVVERGGMEVRAERGAAVEALLPIRMLVLVRVETRREWPVRVGQMKERVCTPMRLVVRLEVKRMRTGRSS